MKYYAGVDIGGMTIKIRIVSENGVIVDKIAFDTESSNVSNVVRDILLHINKLEDKQNLKVCAIGCGVPGVTNTNDGIVISAVNIGWRNVNLVDEFHKQTDLPIGILNDANAAALGEYLFTDIKNECKSMVMVTLGTGVGGGIIIDGKLLNTNYSAGEIGHITIIENGIPCQCGNKGCFEQYASATALMRQVKEMADKETKSILAKNIKMNGEINGKTPFVAQREGCLVADAVVKKYVEYIVAGLINVANIIHPDCILIGGGISREGEKFISQIQVGLDAYIEKSGFSPKIKVRAATLMNDAGMIGAAAFMM